MTVLEEMIVFPQNHIRHTTRFILLCWSVAFYAIANPSRARSLPLAPEHPDSLKFDPRRQASGQNRPARQHKSW
eukprot:750227-Hanusia_phi.AAC.3